MPEGSMHPRPCADQRNARFALDRCCAAHKERRPEERTHHPTRAGRWTNSAAKDPSQTGTRREGCWRFKAGGRWQARLVAARRVRPPVHHAWGWPTRTDERTRSPMAWGCRTGTSPNQGVGPAYHAPRGAQTAGEAPGAWRSRLVPRVWGGQRLLAVPRPWKDPQWRTRGQGDQRWGGAAGSLQPRM